MKMKNNRRVSTPFGDLQIGDMPLDVDNLVEHFFGDRNQGSKADRGLQVPVTIVESESGYELSLELAGVQPANVSVEMVDDVLTIAGSRPKPENPESAKYLREERQFGDFSRSFQFEKSVDADQIEAVFANGLLNVVLPKAARILPRKIEIKTGGLEG
jgi:HSP20 family molecular chaperone IbpA